MRSGGGHSGRAPHLVVPKRGDLRSKPTRSLPTGASTPSCRISSGAVAYETLPKRDRKEKHLAVAAHLLGRWGRDEDEIIEVIASHYLEAFRLAPTAPDAPEVKATAREMIVRAGERAADLAASDGAQGYFEQALELTEDDFGSAACTQRLADGRLGWSSRGGGAHFDEAISILDSIGEEPRNARARPTLPRSTCTKVASKKVSSAWRSVSLLADEEGDAASPRWPPSWAASISSWRPCHRCHASRAHATLPRRAAPPSPAAVARAQHES